MQISDQANLGLTIRNTVAIMQKAYDADLKKNVGINLSQAKVLTRLAIQDGMAQKQIADNICIEAPTLVPIIDKLEREGLVQRRQDDSDRRNNRIYLTDKSRSLHNAIEESIARVRKIAYKGVAKDELETTMRVLNIITKNATEFLESPVPAVEVQKSARK
jgi:MarR family transcriptional regulator for hemolysin